MIERPLIVLDTETTGIADWCEIVELAAVALDVSGQIYASFSTFVKPVVPLTDPRCAPAVRVHGISQEQVEHAPSAEDAFAAFSGWARCTQGASVTAWNVAFDKRFVSRMSASASLVPWGPCLMVQTKQRLGLRSLSLAKAVDHYGLSWVGEAHRALTDAQMAARVWVACNREASNAA